MRHQHKRPAMRLQFVKPPRKTVAYRSIVARGEDNGREYYLHATKGFRSFRSTSARKSS